jgi:hypothetical protein
MTGNACMSCVHFDASVRDREVCGAFPDGIPLKILLGKHSHRTPVEGDHGIRWEPKPVLNGPLRSSKQPTE